MTDLNKFINLYKGLGIDLKVHNDDAGSYIVIGEGSYCDDKMTTSKKFIGYTGFFSFIRFDKSGKFISQGFYE